MPTGEAHPAAHSGPEALPDTAPAQVPDTPQGAATAGAAVGGLPGTGDERVDAAVGRLDELDDLPVSKHAGRYDEVHAALQHVLRSAEQV